MRPGPPFVAKKSAAAGSTYASVYSAVNATSLRGLRLARRRRPAGRRALRGPPPDGRAGRPGPLLVLSPRGAPRDSAGVRALAQPLPGGGGAANAPHPAGHPGERPPALRPHEALGGG